MAAVTITMQYTFPSAAIALDVQNKVSDNWGWKPLLPDGSANPQTRKQFINSQISKILRNAYESECAKSADATRADLIATAAAVSIVVGDV